MTRQLLASLAIVLAAAVPSAQQVPASSAKPPTIEAATIKLSNPNATGPLAQIPMVIPQGPGRLSATNVPLRLLIRMSYQLQDFQIVGGPSWLTSQKFDIVAKAEDGTATDTSQLMPMLRSLLEDRFKLKTHRERREMPVSTLVVARQRREARPESEAVDSRLHERACRTTEACRSDSQGWAWSTGQRAAEAR